MTRGILIAGNESALNRAIAAEAAKRVEHYASALMPSRLTAQERSGAAGDSESPRVSSVQTAAPMEEAIRPAQAGLSLQWNPSSPISARTLVLSAENRLEHINEAILICAPPSIRRPAAELSLSEIEILVNDHIKGWFFLVREISAVFRARKAGILALVYSETGSGGGKDDPADILGPSALASFQAFTRSLLAAAYGEPYLSMGFSCSEAGAETGFASFVMKFMDEGNRRNNGKLHKYGKFSFFR
jgi:NAD(P)-dependent dehydrogenase (short-subunit alcohol dehydrogenase family)